MENELELLIDFISNTPEIEQMQIPTPLYISLLWSQEYLHLITFDDKNGDKLLGITLFISNKLSTKSSEINLWLNNQWSIPIPIQYLNNYQQYIKLQSFA